MDQLAPEASPAEPNGSRAEEQLTRGPGVCSCCVCVWGGTLEMPCQLSSSCMAAPDSRQVRVATRGQLYPRPQ